MGIRSLIPNLFTLGNLLGGVLIIIFSLSGAFELVLPLAIVCLIFDFVDGGVARALNVESPIGKELDSLADMVSFGVAPGIVLYSFYSINLVDNPYPYLFLLIPLFAAFRLAVFNVTEQSKEYFLGLPTPALSAAAFAVPLAANQSQGNYLVFTSSLFMVTFVVLGCVLMVSKLRLFSLKLGSHDKFMNTMRVAYLVLCLIMFLFFKFFGIILCLIIYLVISLTLQKRLKQL